MKNSWKKEQRGGEGALGRAPGLCQLLAEGNLVGEEVAMRGSSARGNEQEEGKCFRGLSTVPRRGGLAKMQ